MPSAAVVLPRHLRLAADLVDFQIRFAARSSRRKIVHLSHDVRPGFQNRRERFARVRRNSSPAAALVRSVFAGAVGQGVGDDLLGRAGHDDAAARFARLGPHVDDPVGRLDHVQIVLDHDHRVAQVDQAVEYVEQSGQIVEVQSGRWLV